MNMHFATVPVEVAQERVVDKASEQVPPLVLLVSEEPVIAETLAAILSAVGCAVVIAQDGLDALETARLMPPQMLIADASVPGANGSDLASEVKQMVPDCEIILTSDQAPWPDGAAQPHAYQAEFVTLRKPVHPTDLLAKVFDRFNPDSTPAPTAPGRTAT